MDYTAQPLLFKLKKAIRYVALYGIRRTIIKVKGQYHMKKKYDSLPKCSRAGDNTSNKHVGILGCGNFAFSNIAYYLRSNYGSIIRGCMDVDINHAASLFEEYNLDYFTDDASEIINDPKITVIYIASNHASHAEYAIQALEAGKNVHIEKPHAVTHEQLERLCATASRSKGRILSIGYNRPGSKIGVAIRSALEAESGESMLNWFVAGHAIEPDHWYFKKEEGGRVLGNLCHWTDFTYQMISSENKYPIKITPTRSKRSDCDIAVTYLFGDGSIAAITFSAKGHTFEGVKERFAAHRGNTLLTMDDFRSLTIEKVDRKTVISPWFRDHGHELSITKSYERSKVNVGLPLDYIYETGELFLRTKDALEESREIVIEKEEMLRKRQKESEVA